MLFRSGLLEDAAELPWDALRERLERLLRDDTPAPLSALPELPEGAPFDRATLQRLSAVCVRTPVYGTRSSTLVALEARRVAQYWFADGPPDQAPFRDVMGLF